MGGAPKQLQKVAVYLGSLGHTVDVLCTRSQESSNIFKWHQNVTVRPILPFKLPFPQPYAVPAYQIANIIEIVGGYLQQADRFYMHDGELLFPWVYQDVPTVVSLRDNVYPETMLGGFLFQGDVLIAISEYSRQFYQYTFGRFFPGLEARMTVVYNGIDFDHFRSTDPAELIDYLELPEMEGPILLHPHRPESSKGLWEALEVVDRLVNVHQFETLTLLAPRWLDDGTSPAVTAFYAKLASEINQRRLTSHVHFHKWIPQRLMPQYYSLGDATVALGHFVESFGNTVYESLACGTPAVAARVSTHRELLPPDLLDTVPYGDVKMGAEAIARIFKSGEPTSEATISYLKAHYPYAKQVERYAELILSATRLGPLAYKFPEADEKQAYKLAPWCYLEGRTLYHDFLHSYSTDPLLLQIAELSRSQNPISLKTVIDIGGTAENVEAFLDAGYIVPL